MSNGSGYTDAAAVTLARVALSKSPILYSLAALIFFGGLLAIGIFAYSRFIPAEDGTTEQLTASREISLRQEFQGSGGVPVYVFVPSFQLDFIHTGTFKVEVTMPAAS
jgi:hypothetical protein